MGEELTITAAGLGKQGKEVTCQGATAGTLTFPLAEFLAKYVLSKGQVVEAVADGWPGKFSGDLDDMKVERARGRGGASTGRAALTRATVRTSRAYARPYVRR